MAYAEKHHRPCLAVDLNKPREQVVQAVVEWLRTKCPTGDGVLNVAGSRESKAGGIQLAVIVRVVDVVSAVNGKMFYPLA